MTWWHGSVVGFTMAETAVEVGAFDADAAQGFEVDERSVPYVVTAAGSLSLHFSFAAIQSRMDLRQPDRLTLAYTRTMMGFLLFQSQARSVAMIGLGGGSLARFMLTHLPDLDLKVVEINPEVIELRETFLLPADGERFQVRCADGAAFVQQPPGRFDVLLVDGFDAGGQPPALATFEFYRHCRATLGRRACWSSTYAPAARGLRTSWSGCTRSLTARCWW